MPLRSHSPWAPLLPHFPDPVILLKPARGSVEGGLGRVSLALPLQAPRSDAPVPSPPCLNPHSPSFMDPPLSLLPWKQLPVSALREGKRRPEQLPWQLASPQQQPLLGAILTLGREEGSQGMLVAPAGSGAHVSVALPAGAQSSPCQVLRRPRGQRPLSHTSPPGHRCSVRH